MTRIESMFADYAEHHQTRGNKICHRVGIPLIVFSLLGLLAHVLLGSAGTVPVDAALVLIAVAGIFYLTLEWRLALAMVAVSILLYLGARQLPLFPLWAIFIFGWVLQFIGHGVYEKRQPAFLRNLAHLLVGPLWILNDVLPVVGSPQEKSPATTQS